MKTQSVLNFLVATALLFAGTAHAATYVEDLNQLIQAAAAVEASGDRSDAYVHILNNEEFVQLFNRISYNCQADVVDNRVVVSQTGSMPEFWRLSLEQPDRVYYIKLSSEDSSARLTIGSAMDNTLSQNFQDFQISMSKDQGTWKASNAVITEKGRRVSSIPGMHGPIDFTCGINEQLNF